MTTKTILFASLVLPLLMAACNRTEQSPTTAAPAQEKQAPAQASVPKAMDSAPPAAGSPAPASGAPAAGTESPPAPAASTAPGGEQQPQSGPAKSY